MTRFAVEPMDRLDLLEADPSSDTIPPRPQDVYFCLDTEDGRVWFEWRCQCEQAVDARVWHGIIRRWEVPVYANGKDLTDAINAGELDELLTRILEGSETVWNGHNHVCRMTEDAQDADNEVQQWFNRWEDSVPECGGLWDAADWFAYDPPEEVTANSTDEELEAVAEKWEAKALKDNVVLVHLQEYLEGLRDQLRKEAKTEEDD